MKRDRSQFKSFKMDKKVLFTIGAVATVFLVTASIVFVSSKTGKEETVVYRETSVEYGNLTVGITEDSSVSIGTLKQTFDLDISALVSSDSSSSDSSSGAGMMGGMSQMGGGNTTMSFSFGTSTFASESQEMEVEDVHITVGQEVQEGDILYTLTESSVNDIRTQLEEDVTDTLSEYDTLQVEQQEERTTAKQGYETYLVNGKLAQLEYDIAIQDLEEAVTEAEEAVTEKQNQVNENLVELAQLQTDLTKAQQDLKDAEVAVSENYDNRYNDPYYYTVYENTREMAQEIVDNLEEEIENLTDENTTLLSEIEEAARTYNQAVRNLETGKLEQAQTLETNNYYASVASEWYAIQTASLDNEKQTAYNDYESAVNKLEEFNSYIVGNDVVAEYSGVITEVPLSVGDSVTRNTTLVSLYDQDAVTMDVTISEEDYNTIDRDGAVNIYYTAYPDDIYTGVISEVSDAEYDSDSGTTYYTMTVTVQGDVSGLYEGMTGEVTFVTKEVQEVLYVSNRAIFREGTRSYVKVRNESGRVIEKDVTTGFSDGVNVEIVEGLSEGDVVLIESQVKE